jgi:DNA (cytosine-5)-methyltransferase 1
MVGCGKAYQSVVSLAQSITFENPDLRKPVLSLAPLTCVEICAGTGGQSLGLAKAGFHHAVLVEIDPDACRTLRANRPEWNVLEEDVTRFRGSPYRGADLLAGGVPCPPFSVAGKQLGPADERDLFPHAIRLVAEIEPRAVMIENVRGLLSPQFTDYRNSIRKQLLDMGYDVFWDLVNASDFGVPQLRPRSVLVALRGDAKDRFEWPVGHTSAPTVGEALANLIAEGGWCGASDWVKRANRIAPTLVGGSKKHGGPDLGPTRAKRAWRELGVDATGVADLPPRKDFPPKGLPKLTVKMAGAIQGFPLSWQFTGRKTAAYRQVGNAFPPPVAQAFGVAIRRALEGTAPKVVPQLVSLRRRTA